MHSRIVAGIVIWFLSIGLGPHRMVVAQGLWQRFVPVDQVECNPNADYTLTQERGPWLISAATFSGDGAEQQARDLALELRRRHNLPAYVHDVAFNLTGEDPGRGIDKYGAPIPRRFQKGNQVREWAVLIGNFTAVDDPDGQKLLERIKDLRPDTLRAAGEEKTAQSLAELRRLQDALLARLGKPRKRGPLSKAFLTPNPLLPREYFVAKGVDDFVADMNKGVKYSLLDCPGKYSVKVATFRGDSVLQTANSEDGKGLFGRKKRHQDSLAIAAENAHLLTTKLREKEWPAFEFHDRTESIVTIGSFDDVQRQLPDGRTVPLPQVQRIIETFGAAYDTPADPLIGDSPLNERRREQAIQQFNAAYSNQNGRVATGWHPKHVKILKGRRLARTLPMDIYPEVIDVPRESVSSAYFRR